MPGLFSYVVSQVGAAVTFPCRTRFPLLFTPRGANFQVSASTSIFCDWAAMSPLGTGSLDLAGGCDVYLDLCEGILGGDGGSGQSPQMSRMATSAASWGMTLRWLIRVMMSPEAIARASAKSASGRPSHDPLLVAAANSVCALQIQRGP